MKKVLFIIFTLLFILSFSIVNAQIPSSIDGVDISMDPVHPTPKELVDVSIVSYLTDLNSASMVWVVDGKTFSKGTGLKSIQVPAPDLGKIKIVTVALQTVEGRTVQKSITIQSGDVDLIWESDGSMPPLFKGKSGLTYQNELRITAIPHLSTDGVSEINPKDLVYKWKVGEDVLLDQSGYGKQYLDINSGNIPKPLDITVTINSRSGNQQTEGHMTLEPAFPSVSFYQIDPLYGTLFNKEVNDRFDMKNSETIIYAFPFGFNKNEKLDYTWSINNIEQPDLSKNQSITLRTKGDVDGSSDINLEIRNTNSILQSARDSFTAFFKKRVSDADNATTF